MALIDRLKERIQTDLTDGELTNIINESTDAVTDFAGAAGAITGKLIAGGTRSIRLDPPAKSDADITAVKEHPSVYGQQVLTLAASDWFSMHRGRTLVRRADGANARSHWGALVEITYAPVDDAKHRDETILKLAILAIRYQGLSLEMVGDVRLSYSQYIEERNRLLQGLAPGRLLA